MEQGMTFWEHIQELRQAVVRCLAVLAASVCLTLFFSKEILAFLLVPLQISGHEIELVLLSPLDGIVSSFKAAAWAGIVATTPYWLYQILLFLLPGLRPKELRMLAPFAIVSAAFLMLGMFTAYTVTIPVSNYYLSGFNLSIGKNLWSLPQYLNYTIAFFLAHCVCFELFATLLFLVHFRIISADSMANKRRHIAVASFILGALLTPPDVLSQLVLSALLLCLYEIAVIYAKMRGIKTPSLQEQDFIPVRL